MSCFLLLLLVVTIYAQEPENSDCNDLEEMDDPDWQEDENDIDSDQCNIGSCHNITLELKNTPENPNVCPGKKTCQYRIFTCRKSFGQARRFCQCNRGKLASIHNAGVNNQLLCQARRTIKNLNWYWIGVSRTKHCGYRNVDGSCFNYKNFANGQCKKRGRWCVAVKLNENGKWFSRRCRVRLPFACII